MVEMNHLLSKQECKVKSFHFEDVTVKTITSLKKITLVTPGPHGSQKKRLLFCCCYWQLSFATQSTTPCWDVTLHCASEGAAWAGERCHCGAFTLVKGSSQNHFILEAKALNSHNESRPWRNQRTALGPSMHHSHCSYCSYSVLSHQCSEASKF